MKLTFLKPKNKKKFVGKEKRFNPHKFWIVYISIFVSFVIIELVIFSLYFLYITKQLDNPVLPKLETNAFKIKNMKKTLEIVDNTLKERVGDQYNQEQLKTNPIETTKPVNQ